MITVGIITASDRSSRGEREDLSGPEIKKWALDKGFEIAEESIVPDDIEDMKNKLIEYSNSGINLILTTGGTGFAPRDITPEATLAVIEKNAPGFAEVMRMKSLEITPHAMLSRAVSGIRKSSLIINLPGSPKAVRENLGFIEKAIPHALDLLKDSVSDCGSV
ncbi:MAG: MogA/MoaB family molybdenum cofactor biosynthesis protein [bacterium]|nr:MogA/MoaB family molybdenum cofactor biosynthesis protein [bacterium]